MPGTAAGPAYRIETERLQLRCWSPGDAPLLDAAIRASLDHLRPWMPWAADEPRSTEERIAFLRRSRGNFDLGVDLTYGILDPAGTEVLGGCGLHDRLGPGALEIGYWIRAGRTGAGLAREAAGALTRVGFEVMGLERIEIHCDPDNLASSRVAARLGYHHEATLERRARRPDGSPRGTMIWTMFRDRSAACEATRVPVRAYDACGRRML